MLESFIGFVQEGLGKDRFHGEDTDVKKTFMRARYVLGGFFPLQEEYDEEGCFIR